MALRPIGKPRGGDELRALIALVTDPAKCEARLNQIEEAINEANAIISKVGDAETVDRLLTEAKATVEQAHDELEAARKEGEQIKLDAKSEADQIRADLNKREEGLNDFKKELEQRDIALDQREAGLEKRDSAVASREKQVDAKIDAAEKVKQEADVAKRKYEDLYQRLKHQLGQFTEETA